MVTRFLRALFLLSVPGLLLWSTRSIRADEPDIDLTNMEIKKLKDLKKFPLPVFAKTEGKGVVKLKEDTRASWSGDTLVYIIGGQLGWTAESTIKLRDGFVFVNVGPSPVKVEDVEIKKGEYALYDGKKFRKVTL